MHDNRVCTYKPRTKQLTDKVYPPGYIQLLETQVTLLQRALREIVRKIASKEDISFLVHDSLQYDSNSNKVTTQFAVNLVLEKMNVNTCDDDDDPKNNFDTLKDVFVFPDNGTTESPLSTISLEVDCDMTQDLSNEKDTKSKSVLSGSRLSSKASYEPVVVRNHKTKSKKSRLKQDKRKINNEHVEPGQKLKQSRYFSDNDGHKYKSNDSKPLIKSDTKNNSETTSIYQDLQNEKASSSDLSTDIIENGQEEPVPTQHIAGTKNLLRTPIILYSPHLNNIEDKKSVSRSSFMKRSLLPHDQDQCLSSYAISTEYKKFSSPSNVIGNYSSSKHNSSVTEVTLDSGLLMNISPPLDCTKYPPSSLETGTPTPPAAGTISSSTACLPDFIPTSSLDLNFQEPIHGIDESNNLVSSIDYLPLCLY